MGKSLFIFKSIWLVDDDPDDCTLFEDAIKEVLPDAVTRTFPCCELLCKALEHECPGLLVLDLHMPRTDGKTCLWKLRRQFNKGGLPVIVCSSSLYPRDVLIAYAMGANLYMTKPTTYGHFVSAIKQVLKMDWTFPERIADPFRVGNKYVPFRAQ